MVPPPPPPPATSVPPAPPLPSDPTLTDLPEIVSTDETEESAAICIPPHLCALVLSVVVEKKVDPTFLDPVYVSNLSSDVEGVCTEIGDAKGTGLGQYAIYLYQKGRISLELKDALLAWNIFRRDNLHRRKLVPKDFIAQYEVLKQWLLIELTNKPQPTWKVTCTTGDEVELEFHRQSRVDQHLLTGQKDQDEKIRKQNVRIHNLEVDKKKKNGEINALKTENGDLREQNGHLNMRVGALEDDKGHLTRQVGALTGQVGALTGQMAEMQQQLRQLQQNMNAQNGNPSRGGWNGQQHHSRGGNSGRNDWKRSHNHDEYDRDRKRARTDYDGSDRGRDDRGSGYYHHEHGSHGGPDDRRRNDHGPRSRGGGRG